MRIRRLKKRLYSVGVGVVFRARPAMEAEAAELDGALAVVDPALSHVKWRLRSSAKRRLEIDLMALCTRMRPVVMVDYGGKLPELQDHLCALLRFCRKESPFFEHLRVMLIEDMIFLAHVKSFAEYVDSSLNSRGLHFVDLEQDPPKVSSFFSDEHFTVFLLFSFMFRFIHEDLLSILFLQMVAQTENSLAGMQLLVPILNLFSQHFPLDKMEHIQSCSRTDAADNNNSTDGDLTSASQNSEFIDLSSCMQGTKISIPTLNGWLLGYPVVYLFSTEHIEDAIYNLSMKSLRIYRVLVHRNGSPGRSFQQEEELMSFSVPYDLSMGGSKEPWAEAFMAQIRARREGCKHAWRTLRLEVSECYPQAIVL
ncbi:hypothetical protein CDL15_Pgr010870 [Punica granatum]|uniref:Uncharacterized protein n=1 Tax=Punica granatum TaxID=22663 RepID=A0A218W761_PUNGR|nr:hypothetical protein CDL15_Pgr010870 [Punica granatum]